MRQRTQAQAPAAAPPTWSPRLLDTPPGHTRCAQTESSLHSHRPLPSLPRPLCNQIPKFRSNPGPSQGSPPPSAACGGPARVLWSIEDPARASWSWELLGAAGQNQPRPHPAAARSGHRGPPWGHPARSHVARHTSSQSYRAFFLLLNQGLGTKPQGGEVWTKEENEWAKVRSELRGSATR